MTSLRDAGLVVSTRGARGGYELARAARADPDERGPARPRGPDRADDLRHATTPSTLACDRSARCTVNVLWVRVRDAITSTLDGMTLADLVPGRHIGLDRTLPEPTPPDRTHSHRSHFVTDANDRELVIRDLRVAPAPNPDHEILQGIDLTIRKGETHAIMGPNGSGKTTLAYALMGHPAYVVKGGKVRWKGYDLLKLSPDKRSRLGLFLAFQYPTAIPGLSVASFIRSALNAKLQGIDKNPDVDPTDSLRGGISMLDFRRKMREKMALLKMDDSFAARYVNDGFSGGEKKRLEMLQMAMLEPEFAVLDETDSGLDIDALRIVAEGVNAMLNPDMGVLLITHYQRLLNYITPDFVHVLAAGRIVTSGGKDLALRLEEEGYGPILREAGLETDVPDDALTVPQEPEAGRGRPMTTVTRPGSDTRGPDGGPVARPLDPRAPARPTSRSSTRRSTGTRWSTSTPRRPRRSRWSCSRRWTPTTASTTRTSTAGSTRSARRRPRRTRRPARASARLIGAPDAHEIVFTRNATEAINLVAYSWGRRNIGRGDVIVLTEMEHHANLVPWQLLAQEKDADLEFIPITDDGILRQDVFDVLLRLKPKLVAFTHVSNTLGTINPVEEMTREAHDAGALVLIDGAQAVPHVPVDVAGDRLRLLRVQRPQDARARRARARSGAAASCSRRCRRSSPAAR